MEVAGIVLGAIPIIISAIDNYHRCLEATADAWRFESTIRLIRSHIFVQQQQLQITFRSLDLTNPTDYELEEVLRDRFPTQCDAFLDIIRRMESLLAKLMDKLDIDAQGRPKWTTEPPDRVVWEWRRVRRGFGRSTRQKIIDELQYWNDALKNCLDKAEVPLESDTQHSTLNEIQSKFSPKNCNSIRKGALQVHEAVSRAWRCQGHEHLGVLKLSWHTDAGGAVNHSMLRLIFPSPSATDQTWNEFACSIVNRLDSKPIVRSAPMPDNKPRPWERMKIWLQPALNQPVAGPAGMETGLVHCENVQGPSAAPPDLETAPKIDCLCSFLHDSRRLGRLSVQGDANRDLLHIRMERQKHPAVTDAAPLAAVFGQPPSDRPFSRGDRFAVAAAASWAVLYLAGSPWMDAEWNGKDRLRLFTESRGFHSHRHYPAIPYAFSASESGRQIHPGHSPYASIDEIKTGIIRNKTLFALGILLIELCLNAPFERLRQEYLSSSLSMSMGLAAPLTDYEIANSYMQRVYLEGGDLYGYAVQRCLRCEFPGRDVTKSFEFEQFRTDFFKGVVAPVQATFSLLQSLHTAL